MKRIKKALVQLNDRDRRIGESHPHARLTDHEVDLVCALLEEGLSYTEVAGKFEVSKSCIAHIARGRRRNHIAERHVFVPVGV